MPLERTFVTTCSSAAALLVRLLAESLFAKFSLLWVSMNSSPGKMRRIKIHVGVLSFYEFQLTQNLFLFIPLASWFLRRGERETLERLLLFRCVGVLPFYKIDNVKRFLIEARGMSMHAMRQRVLFRVATMLRSLLPESKKCSTNDRDWQSRRGGC